MPRWSIIKDSYISVDHFIISHKLHSRNVNRSLSASSLKARLRLHLSKVLFDHINDFVVSHISCGDHDQVLSKIVSLVVVQNLVLSDGLDVVKVSEDGLTHHVLSVDVEVDVFHQSFEEVLVGLFKFGGNHFSLNFNGLFVKSRVLDHVGEDLNSLWNVFVEGVCVVDCEFS